MKICKNARMIPQDALGARSFFYVGGTKKGQPGKEYMEGQMFVEAYEPKEIRHPYPVIFFHGAGQTNINWLVTPDGRKGWADFFLEQGYVVYLAEQPCRGRSAYHYSQDNPLIFHDLTDLKIRFGTDRGNWPQASRHTQWPGYGGPDEESVFLEFAKSQVEYLPGNRLTQELVSQCAGELLSLTGPAILLTHSQAGPFGWNILDQYPDLVKGIAALEPSGPPFGMDLTRKKAANYGISELPLHFEPEIHKPEEISLSVLPSPSEEWIDGLIMKDSYHLPHFAGKPILLVVSEASYHAQFDHLISTFLTMAGVSHDFIRLEDVGIHGNGHMMMLEKNNLEIADFIVKWLDRNIAE